MGVEVQVLSRAQKKNPALRGAKGEGIGLEQFYCMVEYHAPVGHGRQGDEHDESGSPLYENHY